MLRHSGRAALEVGQTVHRVCHVLLTAFVLLGMIALGGAWRLSRGPVNLAFFKSKIEAAVNASIAPARMTIDGASIAWGGFSKGLNQPLVLRVSGLTVIEGAGSAKIQIPDAEASLSAKWLLIGRVLPRAITLDGANLELIRGTDGLISFDLGGAADAGPSPLLGLMAALGAPTQTDRQAGRGRLSQLVEVAVHNGTLLLNDRLLGMTLSADRVNLDLTRHKGGGIDGETALTLALGGQRAVLEGRFSMAPAGRSVHVMAGLSQVTPRALAQAMPIFGPLTALDLPVTVDGEADLGADLAITRMRWDARGGAGTVYTGGGRIPVRRAELVLGGTPAAANIERATVELQPGPAAPISTLTGSGQVTHALNRISAALHVTLDHVRFEDLPALWPPDFSPPTHAWIIENIQTGTAHDGKLDLELNSPDTAPDVTVTKATGVLDGDGVAVTWLPSVPRVEQARAHLVLTDPDKVEIDVESARQKVNGAAPIAIQNSHVTITGVSQKDQVATVRCEATGPLPSAIALLKEPRLRILDRHPMDLRDPAGDVQMKLQVAVPLELHLKIDDVTIHAVSNLTKVHLTGIVAGRDLDDGAFTLEADTSHLSLKGTAGLAGIPSNVDAMMDFRAGPPSQVLQRYVATGRATTTELTAAGLDTSGAVTGDVGLRVAFNEYRSGDGELTADADLTQAELTAVPIGWRKPAGDAATASAHVTLFKDKLTGIDRLTADGPGIQVRGGVTVGGDGTSMVTLDRVALGRTDVRGTIRLPKAGPIAADVSGPSLDVSARLMEKTAKRDPGNTAGPAWSVRGRFDRVWLAHDQLATQVSASIDDDGNVIRSLGVFGKGGAGKPWSARIGQAPADTGRNVRRLTIKAEDAGTLLRGLDLTETILGGELTIGGDFDDTTKEHTLSGTIEMSDFRVANAPALGKLLQAVTLYGLVDALGGTGLNFAELTAPFNLTSDTLALYDARAFSPSLGLTVQGQIDLPTHRLDLTGTVVPAYVFNSLLGRIPFVGRLFSAEKGGGLFAMNYSLSGPALDPTVTANPLSALTPGFLRGLFGLFDQSPSTLRPPLDRQTAGGDVQRP